MDTKNFLFILGFLAAPAYASECSQYLGQQVQLTEIETAISMFSSMKPKGEFESTAQYNKRIEEQKKSMPNTLIIHKVPDDRGYIKYNADSQKLQIITYAFNIGGVRSYAVLDPGKPLHGIIKRGTTNIEVAISKEDAITGTYEGTNSYGATTTITNISRIQRGIFDKKAERIGDGLFPAADEKPHIAGEIPLNPQQARELKQTLQLAFAVRPKFPYIGFGKSYTPPPTMQDPRKIDLSVEILFADIQCGLVLDEENKVLGAFPTR